MLGSRWLGGRTIESEETESGNYTALEIAQAKFDHDLRNETKYRSEQAENQQAMEQYRHDLEVDPQNAQPPPGEPSQDIHVSVEKLRNERAIILLLVNHGAQFKKREP